MLSPGAASYDLARFLLRRGVALIYLSAFLAAATQFRPLAGEDGLLPLGPYVERVRFSDRPSLFYLLPDDRVIALAGWLGVGLAALALLGVPERWGTAGVVTVWGVLWLLYLSFVNAGQTFYGYGWESMLLETGFLAIFLGGAGVETPAVVTWLFRWILFRNMLGAGLIKLRGDECWRELTCMDYHYETQPMPNPVSWYAHHLPEPLHRAAVVVNHVVEVLVPFLYFAPQPVAAVAGAVTIAFQGWLMMTGNFSWLNALTIVLATSTFSDGVLTAIFPVAVPATAPTPVPLAVAVLVLLALVVVLSIRPVLNLLSPAQAMNAGYDPLHLVNTYGAFGSITRTRYELVIQGTDGRTVGPETNWETYTFPGKPTDPSRRPPQVAPYHHRLDWQLWFAAMPRRRGRRWVRRLVAALLAGDDATLGLLRTNPFPENPPTHVRVLRYRYRFTTPAERNATGRWWHRERVETYLPPVTLDDLQATGR